MSEEAKVAGGGGDGGTAAPRRSAVEAEISTGVPTKRKKRRMPGRGDMGSVPEVCGMYIRKVEHEHGEGTKCHDLLHCPKEERPYCPAYTVGVCDFGEKCWYPHKEVVRPLDVNVTLQVAPSHTARVASWCEAHDMAVEDVVRPAGRNRKTERMVMCKVADLHKFSKMAMDPDSSLFTGAVVRIYQVDRCCESKEEAAKYLIERVEALVGEAKEGAAEVRFRLQGYPKKLEGEFADIVYDKSIDGVVITPARATAVGYLLGVRGCIFVGVVDLSKGHSLPLGHLSSVNRRSDASSRAFYKLKEAVERSHITMQSHWHAIDVGASPGGWSQVMAETCERVYAVDPGKVTAKAENIEHMAMLVEKALPILKERDVKLNMFVCDMNRPIDACLECLQATLPMLQDGSPIVVTVKSFTPVRSKWAAAVEEAREQMSKVIGGEVDVYHLMANAIGERTLVGVLSR